MRAIFPARLQPMHQGHKQLIEEYKDKYEEFIVVIGSADKSRSQENPLTVEERKNILEDCFPDIKVGSIEDESKDEEGNKVWIDKMMDKYEPDIVISQNNLVKKLFKNHTDVEVVEQELYEKDVYSGTEVRRRIRSGEEWRYLVPKCAHERIENYLDIFKETGVQYEFKPGWKKEHSFYGTEEEEF